MRFLLIASTAAVAAMLACAPASAQRESGWVDPPVKGSARGGVNGAAEGGAKDEPKGGSETAVPPRDTAAEAAETTPPARSRPQRGRTAQSPSGTHQARRPSPAPSYRTQAAEVRRDRPARARRERDRDERRMAVAPAPTDPAAEAAPDARFTEWAPAAQRLVEAYLDTVSGSNAEMVAAAPRFYAERVSFYGRSVTLSALIADKRRFARRWPDRRYEPQGMRTACHAATATCVVRTSVVFSAANASRGLRSQGVSELALTISFAGGRPVIVGETGQVVRRGGPGIGALPAARRDA